MCSAEKKIVLVCKSFGILEDIVLGQILVLYKFLYMWIVTLVTKYCGFS